MAKLNIEIGRCNVFDCGHCYKQYWTHLNRPEELFSYVFPKIEKSMFDKVVIYFNTLRIDILEKMVQYGFNKNKYEVHLVGGDEGQKNLFQTFVNKNWEKEI